MGCSGPLDKRSLTGGLTASIHEDMFVRLVKKNNDHVSVRVVQNKREGKKIKQKTICCVGHTHKKNKDKIQMLKRLGNNLIRDMKDEMQFVFSGIQDSYPPQKRQEEYPEGMVQIKSLKEESRISLGASDIFGTAYEELNLEEVFTGQVNKSKEVNDLLKEMVLSRLEKPESKRKSVESIKRQKNKELFLDRVYRMMDKLSGREQAIKEKLCKRTLSFFKERLDVIFFDVTTLYFESFVSDELKRPGFSKDRKVKESQVVLALMTTSEGLPLGYEVFPGNVYEGKTLIETIEKMSLSYDIRDVFLVADRGMFSRKNLLEMDKKGAQFIVGARLSRLKKEVRERILSEAPGFLRGESGLRKKEVWRGEYELEGFRLIVQYDRKRAERNRKDRERLLEKIRKKRKNNQVCLMDLTGQSGIRKYLKLERKGARKAYLDKEKIKEEVLRDGFSGVITNHRSGKAGEIIDRYRDLWQIEAAFRLNKNDLKMRPIYHWRPKRIKAHILICFIAYGAACFVRYSLKQAKVRLSFERIREELERVQSSIVKDTKTGRRFILPSKATATQKAIYGVFNKKINQTVQFI